MYDSWKSQQWLYLFNGNFPDEIKLILMSIEVGKYQNFFPTATRDVINSTTETETIVMMNR